MRDLHDRYLSGVSDLLQAIRPEDKEHLTVLALQGRLARAIAEIRQYGPTDSARAEVARVTTELDRITLDRLHQSFRSLCGIPEQPPAQPKIMENLPPRPFFVGRQRELRLLHEYLSPEERVALISVDGIGGIGKTTLVQEIAHQMVESRSFQAVIWATAKRCSLGASGIVEEQPDFTSLDELLGIIARVLHRPSSEAKLGLIRQSLSDIRSLVIVDNFETVQDNRRTFEFLRKLPGNSKALVTNRHRPAAQIRSGELVLPLKGLEKQDAFELLRNAGRTLPPPLSTADASLLNTIYERTHGNPLAMGWVVAQMERGQAIQRILRRLGQPKANDLYKFIFEDSYSDLSENARQALWAIAAIDRPTVEGQICYVADLSPGGYERLVDELIGTSLVSFDHLTGRYSILDMTREYVIALMESELEKWTQRAVEWETQIRFEQLDETAQEAFQLLTRSDKPVPLPTLATWLGGIGANVLDRLVTSLREAGLATFDETLQMVTLAPQVRESWQAELTGSGAITQGPGAVAAAEGGAAIAGDVVVGDGDFVGRDQIIIVQSGRIKDYLRYLVQSQATISLSAIAPSVVEPSKPLQLSDIFIAPYSSQHKSPSLSREPDRQRISMSEAIADDRRVLILGDPGSGKTTFLKYLVGAVARQRLGEAKGLPSEITGFPILVRARDYFGISPEGMPLPFFEFLARHLASLGFSDLIDYVKGQLVAGECIILIDGLDELVSERRRRQFVTQVEDFSLQYPDNRIIITSRTASLQDISLFSAEWARHVIAPFDEEQINWFISAWYRWLASTGMVESATAEGRTKSLSYALRQHRQLGELASNPLLLTVIATLHAYRGRLPEDRVTLYSETSNLLLARWEQTKAPEKSLLERLDVPGLKISDLQAALAEVAFRMQTSNKTVMDKATLMKTLAPYLGSSWDRTLHLAEYMSERAGLLIEIAAEEYSFVHLIFQEFFAARYLSSQMEYPRIGVKLLAEDFHRWREVYLQSILYLAQSYVTSKALEAIQALCPPAQWNPSLSEDIDLLKLILAGQAIVEIGLLRIERTEVGKQIVDSVRSNLVQLIHSGGLSASERERAGDILGEIGDPRFSSTLVGDLLVPDIVWCEVPDGPFLMGSSEARDANAYDDEKPQHRVELPSYRIGLYPVTNAQYRLFVEGGGYEDSRYWLEEGWVWRSKNGIVAPEFWNDPMWNSPNHPVVGVSWYEAIAFATWLAAQLDMPIQLPTEAEWEKAARGDDGRIYPWGDEWDPERANTQETGIGQTSTVGVFPAGAGPYGCLDMSGNVWEWTLSLWGQQDARAGLGYPYDPSDGREDPNTKGTRIIRGGSWASSPVESRIAFRGAADPAARSRFVGFRCKSVSAVDEAVQRAITRIKQARCQ